MSTQATVLIARRSIRARLGRLIAISIAIVVGVSFVVGSFVLADSLRKTFDDLFTNISKNVDLQVRASVAFGEGDASTQRDPIPASLLDTVRGVDGVKLAEPSLQRYAQLLDKDGKAVTTQGAPTLGVSWSETPLSGLTVKAGKAPSGVEQVAIDKATADRENFKVGDKVQVLTDTGTHPATITALVGLGGSDGFAGATLVAWDPASAQTVLGAQNEYDSINVQVADSVDPATVIPKIKSVLPAHTEVVTRDVIIKEAKQQVDGFITAFGTGLLDVRLHHRVRQRFPDQQRVPDHDRPAAAGAGDDAGDRCPRQPGQTPDLHRGAGDVGDRHARRHRRRRSAWPSC